MNRPVIYLNLYLWLSCTSVVIGLKNLNYNILYAININSCQGACHEYKYVRGRTGGFQVNFDRDICVINACYFRTCIVPISSRVLLYWAFTKKEFPLICGFSMIIYKTFEKEFSQIRANLPPITLKKPSKPSAQNQEGDHCMPWTQREPSVHRVAWAKIQCHTCFYFWNFI